MSDQQQGYTKSCHKYAILATQHQSLPSSDPNESPKLAEKLYITQLSFAPKVFELIEASESMNSDHVYDPATMWWYLEAAYWYWHIPAGYFNTQFA